jgi:tagatose 1,6-diphosphate aldolase
MAKKPLTVGKYRAFQRSSTAEGSFAILAIDHQDALREYLRPNDPKSLPTEDIITFKMQVTNMLATEVSGVLLDPIFGAPQAIAQGILNGHSLLVELEKADYQMQPLPLNVEIDPDWNVAKIKRMGADGVKLFFYYNAANREHADRQDAIVRQTVADCTRHDIPFYAEPIFYPNQQGDTKRTAVVESARRLSHMGVDVLKLEFPVDVEQETDEAIWAEACAEITGNVDVPWVLLSAGVAFEMFARQLEIACKAGAAGFIVGRAVWGDVATITGANKRREWLNTEGRRRLQLLGAIVHQHAYRWSDWYDAPDVTVEWFRQYGEY